MRIIGKLAELKIKIGSLGLEQTLIRRSEDKHRARARKMRRAIAGQATEGAVPPEWADALERTVETFWSLRRHRDELRAESRAAMLALVFLRGRPYASAEAVARWEPNWSRVWQIAAKFSGTGGGERAALEVAWGAWREAGETHYRAGQSELARREQVKRGRAEQAQRAETAA